MRKALVVDDDRAIRRTLEMHLTEEGFSVLTAADGLLGSEMALSEEIDLMLLDLRLPKMDGFDVLKKVKAVKPSLPIIMITAYDDMHTAIEAIRLGALDHLGKPIDLDDLDETINKVIEMIALAEKGVSFCETSINDFQPNVIVGRSKSMKAVYKVIGAVADTSASVLLYGESGTGKEMVARALHFNGKFRNAPFIPVVCSSLASNVLESELFGHEKGAFTGAYQQKLGKFELAQSGTLFLDEISEISATTQLKLLRFLQEKEFERVGGNETIKADVRIITASNKDLAALVVEGKFRKDLYYRLKVVTIELPALRDRKEDIPLLVKYFLEKIKNELDRSVEVVPEVVMQRLLSHDWPGNVRELENALRRSIVLSPSDVLLPENLQLETDMAQQRLPLQVKTIQEIEQEHIENILLFTGYEKKRAAQILNMSRPTLNARIQTYNIQIPDKSN